MEESCHSSAESTSSSTADNLNNRDHYLKHLNKLSHKISKPSASARNPSFELPHNLTQAQLPPPPPQTSLQAQQHHPPVYNINKNDFRDVVQKLTGSPAHERFPTPPPIHQPKPQSSRLQRIRPPPLAQVSNRPPPMMNCAVPNMNPFDCPRSNPPAGGPTVNTVMNQRPPATAPLSPLPPFPAVHAAAESPVSAYMRYVQNSKPSAVVPSPKQFAGFPPLAPLVSPRWNNLTPPQQQQSPLPFGCLNSPRSPYALLSPTLLFSPNSGQLGFPLSPTVPVPGPKWPSL
ncbi:VQ motif-containing protein 9 [Hibiscus trionum]|uniref:VQ motif-containing protein 9 n=1 Tax=Hibiscus trionum TaxID=183268 RepID=A0A9W7LQC6_HIBTR|nr:VQ motif-containing protein 9 [Hibiscus trionum]